MGSQLLRDRDSSDAIAVDTDFAQPRRPLTRQLGHLLAWIVLSLQIRRERKQLAGLSDDALRDIGITRAQAERESYKGLASIPPNRLKRSGFRRR